MAILELSNFYDERFTQCFRAYFLEIGVNLKADTDVFDDITKSYEKENMRTFVIEEEKQFVGFIMLQPEYLKSGFFEEPVGFIRELWGSSIISAARIWQAANRNSGGLFQEEGNL